MAASKQHAAFCFDVLNAHFHDHRHDGCGEHTDVDIDLSASFPLFVTWQKRESDLSYALRGCIGSFAPMELNDGLRYYTLKSAFEDRRFPPLDVAEVPLLRCSVSLLSEFRAADDIYDWKVGVHGIRIAFDDHEGRLCSATYLPEVAAEQRWSQPQCIDALMRKAGYQGPANDAARRRVRLFTYTSSRATLSYHEYTEMRRPSDQ